MVGGCFVLALLLWAELFCANPDLTYVSNDEVHVTGSFSYV